MVPFSVVTYELKDGGSSAYEKGQDHYGKIVLKRTKKYENEKGLMDYPSSHTYDLNTLGFSPVLVIE